MSTAYEILGVPENATDDEIRRAHRRLTAEHSPDRFMTKSACEQETHRARHLLVQRAHLLLGTPEARRTYDERLSRGRRPVEIDGETEADATDPYAEAKARAALLDLADSIGFDSEKRRTVATFVESAASLYNLFQGTQAPKRPPSR